MKNHTGQHCPTWLRGTGRVWRNPPLQGTRTYGERLHFGRLDGGGPGVRFQGLVRGGDGGPGRFLNLFKKLKARSGGLFCRGGWSARRRSFRWLWPALGGTKDGWRPRRAGWRTQASPGFLARPSQPGKGNFSQRSLVGSWAIPQRLSGAMAIESSWRTTRSMGRLFFLFCGGGRCFNFSQEGRRGELCLGPLGAGQG